MKDYVDEARHRVLQAIGALLEASEEAKKFFNLELHDKLYEKAIELSKIDSELMLQR